eukprot:gnl/TRDRNA2_/TRDRNA2_126027_c0_seq1.p1 gnl/TRDRNA2_/TRDRNA2_126027_c0~~gnl/TRDRNA2_/TRDRNA2_126027_c0_seq1.p1  ORF type:complete len:221 (-),score=46.52 gnl/TRDRNA2_/TRDRNA2_126027_c0_seq1:265-927(-)
MGCSGSSNTAAYKAAEPKATVPAAAAAAAEPSSASAAGATEGGAAGSSRKDRAASAAKSLVEAEEFEVCAPAGVFVSIAEARRGNRAEELDTVNASSTSADSDSTNMGAKIRGAIIFQPHLSVSSDREGSSESATFHSFECNANKAGTESPRVPDGRTHIEYIEQLDSYLEDVWCDPSKWKENVTRRRRLKAAQKGFKNPGLKFKLQQQIATAEGEDEGA